MRNKKKVLYLIGAGATHSEVRLYDNNINLLTKDIADGIKNKIIQKKLKGLTEIVNDLTGENIDIEQLITLYEASGYSKNKSIAKNLRNAFVNEIQERLAKLPKDYKPLLLSSLIDLYDVKNFDEELCGFLTLNYDSLIEVALQNVKSAINLFLLIDYKNTNFINGLDGIPIIKLHGSFNWKNEFPICLINEGAYRNDILWIPPGVVKRREEYPFSMLWGKAKELLQCDILRVIGCSLNRNDWELVSLLQTTQRFQSKHKRFTIELIDYDDEGQKKKKAYPYLNLKTVLELEGFKKHLLGDVSLTLSEGGDTTKAFEDYVNNKNNINIFERWLRWRGEEIKELKRDISTPKNIFKNFIEYKYENLS
jgi:hypothetical protein